ADLQEERALEEHAAHRDVRGGQRSLERARAVALQRQASLHLQRSAGILARLAALAVGPVLSVREGPTAPLGAAPRSRWRRPECAQAPPQDAAPAVHATAETLKPTASRSSSFLSVRSQVNSFSERPK